MSITFGSVCSGIEAASVALHPLGWKSVWLSEIAPYPAAVLAYHYPSVPNLGDMTKIARAILVGEVEAPDALIGGTPCQAFSVAGLREGLADERGQLTLAYVRIFDAIDYVRRRAGKRPAIGWWENVPGVLSSKDNAFGCFLAGLAGEDRELQPPGKKWPNAGVVVGPTRTVAWRVLDAQYFGVAQRRRRVFVIASARKDFDPVKVLFEFDGVRRDSAPSRETQQDVAGTLASRTEGGGFPGTDEACSGYVQPVASTGHVSHCLNAGGMGRQDFETETLITTARSVALRGREGGGTAELGEDIAGCLRASSGGGDKPHVLAPVAIAFDARQTPVASERVFGALGSSHPQAQAVAYAIQAGALRTNPMSGPDGVGVQEGVAYTMEARAEVQCVCVTGDVTHTLKAEGFDASEDGTGRGQPIVAAFAENSRSEIRFEGGDGLRTGTLSTGGGKPGQGTPMALVGMAVRRLTPRECERLQGFPDDYTAVPWNGWRAMDDSETPESCRAEGLEIRQNEKTGKWRVKDVDGPRYKALGNSMAVPVMHWIGSRIEMVDRLTTTHED
ncbi:DNA cytosine methyltransferase [Paraburkholderia tropica]|uniref:DNA cytosine methyltransferase n=1 Tax=Paraburkholderia tropica TaxID=92647 RepID=UPI002AB74E47|nr:DNA cytosine methyltransferase [Paraburkholderia tropica]